ncbi:MAG TPA: beta-N-acetylhexosaminidase [Sphingobacteriaceae bacterium]
MKIQFLVLFITLLFVKPGHTQVCPIIPLPETAIAKPGYFIISKHTPVLINDPSLRRHAAFLQNEVLKTKGVALAFQDQANAPAIKLVLSGKNSSSEAYKLSIEPSEIKIISSGEKGIFYGINSLIQLIRQLPGSEPFAISGWEITDKPALAWRGIMLDESRHFFGKETVKEMLDWMAFYKLNKFHWHLTDAPGWRLEIKKYPKLTLVGGIGNHTDSLAPAKYYTQEDIKEIVAYAAERYITVIPEIDMPGHARSANMAYPEYSGGGTAKYPEFTFNPGKEKTYSYLTDILREVNVLFPSGMIHLGGDEVSFGSKNWERDSGVKQLMQKNDLKNLKEVEDYFVRRMADTVFQMNNKVLLWDEAATGDLPSDKTIIFWWRHDRPEQLKMALDKGYSVVLCPRVPFYFDFIQDTTQRVGRIWKGAIADLRKVYDYMPEQESVIGKRGDQILGVQANLWTENLSTVPHLQYMLFPRIGAFAESAWSAPGKKDYTGFLERLKPQLELYKQDKIYYYNPFNPAVTPEPLPPGKITINR